MTDRHMEQKIAKVVDKLVLCHASLMYIEDDVFNRGITLTMDDYGQYNFYANGTAFTFGFVKGFVHGYLSLLALLYGDRHTLQKAVVLAACNVLEEVLVDLRDLFGSFSYVKEVRVDFRIRGIGIRIQYIDGTCIHTKAGVFHSVWDAVNQVVKKSEDKFNYDRKQF